MVSRRAVLEETRAEGGKLLEPLQEGAVVKGVVKNITDYGAFVDLGGIDGLLHITDMAWRRVQSSRPKCVNVGDEITAKILKFDREKNRVSLGLKQLRRGSVGRHRRAATRTARACSARSPTSPTTARSSRSSPASKAWCTSPKWTGPTRTCIPAKVVQLGDEVEVMVLEIDEERRRISLGMKQCMPNPWEEFAENHKKGDKVKGHDQVDHRLRRVRRPGRRHRRPGAPVRPVLERPGEEAVRNYKKGEEVEAMVLSIDVERERISLGIKQLEGDPMESAGDLKKGSVVTCEVTEVKEGGIEAKILGSDLTTFIKRAELARDRGEQRPERFAVGQKVNGRIIQFDRRTQKVTVSIKALEVAEEKEAIAQYGSSNSGATLGDILGTALKRATEKPGEKDENDESSTGIR